MHSASSGIACAQSVFKKALLVSGNDAIYISPVNLYKGHRLSWVLTDHQAFAVLSQSARTSLNKMESGPGISVHREPPMTTPH